MSYYLVSIHSFLKYMESFKSDYVRATVLILRLSRNDTICKMNLQTRVKTTDFINERHRHVCTPKLAYSWLKSIPKLR